MNAFEKIVVVRAMRGISYIQKLIMLTLVTHIGEHDSYCVSITTLQKECCIASRSTITENIQKLIKYQLLEILSPRTKDRSQRYMINFTSITQSSRWTSPVSGLVQQMDQASPADGLPQSSRWTSASPSAGLINNINNINKKNNSDVGKEERKNIRRKLGLRVITEPIKSANE